MAAPFLLIRDPLALAIWILGARWRVGAPKVWIAFYFYTFVITVLALLQLMTSTVLPLVVLYGWRSYVLHIPVVIVMSSFLDRRMLVRVGRWILFICPPMCLLMIIEYLAPESAWINKGAGEGAGQIIGALGHIRPSGTFSYNLGLGSFFACGAAFSLWGFTEDGLYPRWLLILAAVSIAIAVPVSVSRGFAITIAMMLLGALAGVLLKTGVSFKVESLPGIAVGLVLASGILFGLAQVPLVADAIGTFSTRWVQAQDNSGNSDLEDRSSSAFTSWLQPIVDGNALGEGIGSGSNVAASIRGDSSFSLGENPLEREASELGSVVGSAFIAGRLCLAGFFAFASVRAILKGSLLAWFLLFPSVIGTAAGTLDVASQQGFIVVFAGLQLAALKLPGKQDRQ